MDVNQREKLHKKSTQRWGIPCVFPQFKVNVFSFTTSLLQKQCNSLKRKLFICIGCSLGSPPLFLQWPDGSGLPSSPGGTTMGEVAHQDTISCLRRWWSYPIVNSFSLSWHSSWQIFWCDWVSFSQGRFPVINILSMWYGSSFLLEIKHYINWQGRTATNNRKNRA